jgi:hypothetical protein
MATWTGGAVAPIGGGGITNAAGAMFYARAEAANLSYFSNDLTGFFNNQGTLVKRGSFRTDIRATFDNAAVVNVEAGELRFVANSFGTGRFNVSPGARVFLSSGMYNMRGNAIVAGEGLLEVGQFGDLHVGQAAAPADASVSNLSVLRGGLRIIPGSSLTLTGGGFFDRAFIDGAGTMKIAPGVDVRAALGLGPMAITQTVVENEGELTVEGGGSNSLALQNDAWIGNKFGGVFNLTAPATLITTTDAAPGGIRNDGSMLLSATPLADQVSLIGLKFTNAGHVRVAPGTRVVADKVNIEIIDGDLSVGRDATIALLNAVVRLFDGRLGGNGAIGGDLEAGGQRRGTAAARVAPGEPLGKFTVGGNVTLGNNAEVFIELGGRTQETQYDLLDVAGTAALDGDLLVDLVNGFGSQILQTDVFTVLTADAPLTGAFDNVASGGRVTGVDGVSTFRVNYGPGSPFDPNAVVLSDFVAIPEPGTGAAVCVGAAFLTARRRRDVRLNR